MRNLILVLWLFILTNIAFSANSTYIKGTQIVQSNQSVVSSGGTLTLTAASPMGVLITGSSNHTVKLPSIATIFEGSKYHVINSSTQAVSVIDSSSTLVATVSPNTDKSFEVYPTGLWAVSAGGSTGKALAALSPISIAQDATSATVSLGIADYFDFNTSVSPSAVNGRLHYDQTDKTLTLDVDTANGVSLQVGEEQYIRARNITGSTITDGTVVYITGADSGRPTVSPATTAVTVADKTIGVATQNILTGTEGMITTSGKVGGYNTSGFTAGARLYLSGTGALSMTPPSSGIIPVAWALDSTASGKILVDVRSKVDSESLDPTGFTDTSAVTVSYDSATRKVTLTGSFRALWRGQYISVLTNGYVSPAHAATNGAWYLYYDGTNVVWSQTPWTFDMVQIATVNYDGVNNIGVRETHGTMGYLAHQELHNVVGTYVKSGGDFSSYVLASTTAANRRPDISATTIYDEDLPTIEPALTSKLYTKFFLSGASTGNYTVETADIVPLNGTVPYYNQFTGGNWVQTPMTNNTYQAIFVIAIPTSSDTNSQKYRYMFVQGQTLSSSLGTIQGLAPSDVNLNGLNTNIQEIVFIGKIIIQYVAGGTNNWNLVSVQKLVGSKFSQSAVSGGTYLSSVSTNISYITGSGIISDPLTIAPAKITLIDSLTGTANYVPKFTGSALTSSLIYDNGTNVGISNSSPSSRLVVKGATSDNSASVLNVTNSGDGSLLYVRNDGEVLMNSTTPYPLYSAGSPYTPTFQMNYASSQASMSIIRFGANANPSRLAIGKSRGATVGAAGAALDGDWLSMLAFVTSDGTNQYESAAISAYADGNASTQSIPTRLVFSTTATGTYSLTERMRIDQAGNIGIGNSAPATKLHVGGDVTITGYTYFGLPTVDGSYRMYVSSGALVTEKRVSGSWVEVARLDNN